MRRAHTCPGRGRSGFKSPALKPQWRHSGSGRVAASPPVSHPRPKGGPWMEKYAKEDEHTAKAPPFSETPKAPEASQLPCRTDDSHTSQQDAAPTAVALALSYTKLRPKAGFTMHMFKLSSRVLAATS